MGIWDDVKNGTLQPTATSAWNNLKKDRISENDLLAPTPSKSETVVKADNEYPAGTISFDIETGSVDEMWKTGSEFLRLSGYSFDLRNDVWTTTDHRGVVKAIEEASGWVIGHNILNYDLILLAKNCGLNLLKLAKQDRIIDTKLLAFLADPPLSRTKEGEIERMFSLDNTGLRYLGEGKVKDIQSGKSVLKELAKEFGGFDKIPVNHPQYVEYLKQDVVVTRDLARVIPMNDYARREHRINAVASTISMQGFRVDPDLLESRIIEGEEKRLEILTQLMEYGLPGPETTKAPHRTNAGVAAINAAFSEMKVTLPKTPTGRPALGKDILLGVIEETDNQAVIDLAESVLGLNGIRTIYANIKEYMVDGRIHPSINLRQSSGRWSIQKPGLTVVGKRGGKVKERAVFLPDSPDHVLISCDLSQVDARAVAGLSQDLEYLQLFEPGRDLHTEMAVRLFGTAEARERAKAAVHGINYGMRAHKLAITTGMTELEAADAIYEFERNFPRLTDWQNEMRYVGETAGVLYNGYGRLMRIEPERAFTQAPALLGQSTARDILCEGILRLWNMGGEEVINMIRGVIHDEVVLSVPIEDVEEIEKIVVESMSFEWCPDGAEHAVAITAGLNSRGDNWALCYAK